MRYNAPLNSIPDSIFRLQECYLPLKNAHEQSPVKATTMSAKH